MVAFATIATSISSPGKGLLIGSFHRTVILYMAHVDGVVLVGIPVPGCCNTLQSRLHSGHMLSPMGDLDCVVPLYHHCVM